MFHHRLHIDAATSADVQAAFDRLISHELQRSPGLGGASGELVRLVLQCLVRLGLEQGTSGQFKLHPVHVAQLGAALHAAFAERPELSAVYVKDGPLETLLRAMQGRKLVHVTKNKLVMVHMHVAKQLSKHAGSQPQRAATPATPDLQPAQGPAARPPPPPPPPSRMPDARLIASEQQAAAAVTELLAAGEVAMDCEGDLRRGGSVSLIQLYAPAAAAVSPCYVFDLEACRSNERPAVMARLQSLLESGDVVKASRRWPACKPALPLHLPSRSSTVPAR